MLVEADVSRRMAAWGYTSAAKSANKAWLGSSKFEVVDGIHLRCFADLLKEWLMFIIVETFLNPGEPSSASYRVRPLPGQSYPPTMRVQCSRAMRYSAPLGARFRLWVNLVVPENNTSFLRHVNSDPWDLVP